MKNYNFNAIIFFNSSSSCTFPHADRQLDRQITREWFIYRTTLDTVSIGVASRRLVALKEQILKWKKFKN